MRAEPSQDALENTPRRRQRWFTQSTLNWFELGEQIARTPQEDEYERPPSRRWPVLVHALAVTAGWSAGMLVAWLVL